jgi:hypothetical protein
MYESAFGRVLNVVDFIVEGIGKFGGGLYDLNTIKSTISYDFSVSLIAF